MDESAVVICANDGVGILIKRIKESDSQRAFSCAGSDPLMTKKIETKWKIPTGVRKCEANYIGNNAVIIVLGSADDRVGIFKFTASQIKSYSQLFNQQIPLQKLCDVIGNEMNKTNICGACGCDVEVILASWSYEKGSELFAIDSDGSCYKYQACAIGEDKEAIKMTLSQLPPNLSTSQCLVKGLKILMNESDDGFEFDLMRICSETQANFEYCDDNFNKQILMKALRDDD